MDVITKCFILLCIFLHFGTSPSVQAETHSLYYIYTGLSKAIDLPGIYDFIGMGLLDDRQIDYYDSKERKKIPKQEWMKGNLPADYWEKGTQSRKSKEQSFNENIKVLMERHNESDHLHVLQWRHGCEIEKEGNETSFSKGISEYAYDGENFLSFDDKTLQWVATVREAVITKNKWENMPYVNQYTKYYLEKECVDWLKKFLEYGDKELRKSSPPEVRVFSRSQSDKNTLRLTCMATGFYGKDISLIIRKNREPLSEDKIETTGVRPNHDVTYQLRKSLELMENENEEDYDCLVTHKTLQEPIISKWENLTQTQISPVASGSDTETQLATAINIMYRVLQKQYDVLTLEETKLRLEIQKLELEKTKLQLELQKLRH
ncbi:major histocompatibility complex class I-related gene protein isoform X2 [Misgurnus anguillicaudatus]|uniref:major histocompatibility complex class I-related gene protein isoform X2 n=1 Tax=Misgurnus anguillicaudatus TaxID=75329 RepID=UPI003CCF3FDB